MKKDYKPSSLHALPLGLGAGLVFALLWVALSLLVLAPTPEPALPALALPPEPSPTPGFAELDPLTKLHITGTAQTIDLAAFRLSVQGRVRHPLSLTYDELRRLPRLTTRDPIICKGYFEDYAHWAGASLLAVLDRAGAAPEATKLVLISADGYESQVSMEEARSGRAFLAYEWEGRALPRLHGYPLRAAFPGLPGNRWVKWLVGLRVEGPDSGS